MTLSYKTLLIACMPFSIQSMEPVDSINMSYAITNHPEATNIITTNKNELSFLYKKTHEMLDKYEVANPKTTTTLLDIINTTISLKNEKKILEQHIGLFSFNQNKEPFFKVPPYNGSTYISVLFARIKQYNIMIAKNEFITPTLEQITQFKNNNIITSACNTTAEFGLFLNLALINNEKTILTPLSNKIAFQDFQQLLDDIAQMIKKDPQVIKTIAETLYANKTTPTKL
jgi:hypothetical protein